MQTSSPVTAHRYPSSTVVAALIAAVAVTAAACSSGEEHVDTAEASSAAATAQAAGSATATDVSTVPSDSTSAEASSPVVRTIVEEQGRQTTAEAEGAAGAAGVAGGLSPAGTVCAEVPNDRTGKTTQVVALEDDTDCATAVRVVKAYFDAFNRPYTTDYSDPDKLPPQGSGAHWDSPEGWHCSGSSYLIPGDDDAMANRQMACGSAPAATGATGRVTMISPEDLPRVQADVADGVLEG